MTPRLKIITAIIGYSVMILVIISIFINQDYLLKVQLPLLIVFSAMATISLASYILGRLADKIRNERRGDWKIKNLFLEILPYINWVMVIYFGIMSILASAILIFLT